MSSESAAPAAPARPSWRESLTDPTVVAIALYALVAIGALVAGYFALFTQFAPYDDEGTLLVTLNGFAHGHALYNEIYTPYGPFYYELFGGLLALIGHDITTDLSRMTVLVLWVGMSLVSGITAQRLTGRLELGLAGMIAAFATLYVLAGEPMHPQGLCVVLLGFFTMLAVFGPGRRERVLWTGGGAGVLLAALVLTKLNLGVLAVAATVIAAAVTIEPLANRRWIRWPVTVVALVFPLALTGQDLDLEWVRNLTAMEILSIAAILVAAWSIRPPRGEDDPLTPRWIVAAAIGFAVAFVAIMVAIVLDGSTLSEAYEGMVTEAQRVREVNMTEFPNPAAAVDWALAAVAAAAIAVWARWGGERPSIWPGLLRAAAGLTIWFSISKIAPIGLNPSVGNPDSLAAVLAWVAVLPPGGVVKRPYERFLRVLLATLAVAETLQVYPVAGSQMGIAAFVYVPVGALILADALTSLRAWSEARGGLAAQRLGVIVGVVAAAVAVDFAINSVARPAINGGIDYHHQKSLDLPGASALRLPLAEAEAYERLIALLHENKCTTFVGYPNIDSFYLWAEMEPPLPYAPGAWVNALDSERQQTVVDELKASPRPCLIRSDGRAQNWLRGNPPPARPLANYVLNDFQPVDEVGEFLFELPNG
ncbi:MAG TPA: hypothetical protein VHZ54_18505 [Solirubrobacterales bacterium]|jgi:hypothetical protein|nr:hypothetical protein [Solirubrobacterales bacterium]